MQTRIFRKIGRFIETKRPVILGVSVALIALAVIGVMQVNRETGTETFVSTDSQVYKDYDRFNEHFSSDVIAVLISGDDISQILQPENIQAMDFVETQMGAHSKVISVVGPISLIKQAVDQQGDPSVLQNNPQAFLNIATDSQTGTIREEFTQVFPDSEHALIFVVIEGGMSSDEKRAVIEDIEEAVTSAGFTGVEPVITGQPVLDIEMEDMMSSTMRNMLVVAIVLMLIILALVFSIRGFFAWRWLPLGMVLMGIVYTFGIMGVLSIPITMVTMATFPILIGLGVDYAIQFYNRYDEETGRGESIAGAIVNSITHIGPAIGIALVATCLGFAALFFSPVPMIQDFGSTLIIGVVASYLLSMFFLLAILYQRDRRKKIVAATRKEKARGDHVGLVERGLHSLAPWVIKKPYVILPIALVLCVIGVIADDHIKTETDTLKFLSPDLSVVQNLQTLEEVSGGRSTANLLIESTDVTDSEILTWIVEVEGRINEDLSDVVSDTNSIVDLVMQRSGGEIPSDSDETKEMVGSLPAQMRRNLVTDDWSAANVVISVGDLGANQIQELIKQLNEYAADAPASASISVTSSAVVRDKLVDGLTGGRVEMTLIGIGFVFAGLFLFFRLRIIRALIAILPIGLIIGWSSGVMYLSGIKYSPITATLGALIIGIGVEFTIMLMARYYEERDKGESPVSAMTVAMTKIGRALYVSAFTTVGGFGALLIAMDFTVLQDFGIVTMINVLFALISTLFVLPPLIVGVDSWLGKHKLGRLA
ncbi:MAG: RND family transporter [Chloroflexi bacterium]|nr:RND family transporter [Chloroflexota bacterium]